MKSGVVALVLGGLGALCALSATSLRTVCARGRLGYAWRKWSPPQPAQHDEGSPQPLKRRHRPQRRPALRTPLWERSQRLLLVWWQRELHGRGCWAGRPAPWGAGRLQEPRQPRLRLGLLGDGHVVEPGADGVWCRLLLVDAQCLPGGHGLLPEPRCGAGHLGSLSQRPATTNTALTGEAIWGCRRTSRETAFSGHSGTAARTSGVPLPGGS